MLSRDSICQKAVRYTLGVPTNNYLEASDKCILPAQITIKSVLGAQQAIHPQDERGEEMCEDARVWGIYIDESTKFDASMTDGWNRSLDVLLVFVSTDRLEDEKNPI